MKSKICSFKYPHDTNDCIGYPFELGGIYRNRCQTMEGTFQQGSETIGQVVVVPLHYQGHINPLLEFAKRLEDAAHGRLLVTFATTEESQSRMLKAAAVTSHNKTNDTDQLSFRFCVFEDGLPKDFVRRVDHERDEEALRTIGSKNFEKLLTRIHAQGPPVLCVVYDSFLQWIPSLAHKMDIPCAMLWTQSCAVFSLYCHAYHKGLRKITQVEDLHLPAAMPALKPRDLPSFLQESDKCDGLAQWFTRKMDHLFNSEDKPEWILVNSFEELERAEIMSVSNECRLITIGPLVPAGFLLGSCSEDERGHLWKAVECREWLDSKSERSVVYAAFGSLKAPPKEQIDEIAYGLLNSNQSFLWIIRPEEGTDIADMLPSGFMEQCKDRGLIVPWCSQLQVLSHPAIGVFLSHCGWNSTLEAISQGVPVLAAPIWTDQPTDAFYLTSVWKTGLFLDRNDDGILTREVIAKNVTAVFEDKEGDLLRSNACSLRDAARTAMGDGGSSNVNISEFVKDVIARRTSAT